MRGWCEKTGVSGYTDDASMMELPAVKALISKELSDKSLPMRHYERPHKWDVIMEVFSQVCSCSYGGWFGVCVME